MPQFDFYSFSTQVFWVLVSFFIFYFFILKYFLVNFSMLNKIRRLLKNIETFVKKN